MTRAAHLITPTLIALALVAVAPAPVDAHCDTVDGPVAVDARAAFAAGDVTPTLKWVQPADEAAIRDAFARTLAVRGSGDAARELAETWFLETLIRIHRAGEGAPYTGLKPAGTVEPGILAADHALATGDADALVVELTGAVESSVRSRFERVAAARAHADHNVAAGRAYVAAYVDYVHFVERLHTAINAAAHHGEANDSGHAAHAH